jgi:tetratricopeptide (TPR) repeat protein
MSPDGLQDERDMLIASLEDLEREHDRGDLSDEDYALLHDRYTARAAKVLRALDGARTSTPVTLAEPGLPGASDDARPRRRSRARRRWWWAVTGASLAVIVVAIVVVTRTTSSRLPGGTATGSVSLSAGQLESRTLEQAQVLEGQGDASGALKLYHEVLEKDPIQEEALAESGWLEFEAGVKAESASALSDGQNEEEKAERADPSASSPHLYLGSMLFVEGQAKDAVTQFRAFLASSPPSSSVQSAAPFIERAFQEAGLPPPPMPAGS